MGTTANIFTLPLDLNSSIIKRTPLATILLAPDSRKTDVIGNNSTQIHIY